MQHASCQLEHVSFVGCMLRPVTKPLVFSKVTITENIKEDLKVGADFLTHFNGKSFYAPSQPLFSDQLNFLDSSFKGFMPLFYPTSLGARSQITENAWLKVPGALPYLPQGKTLRSKTFKQTYNLPIFQCDNLAVVHVLNKRTTPVETVMFLVQKIVIFLLNSRIILSAVHIPGFENTICDSLP